MLSFWAQSFISKWKIFSKFLTKLIFFQISTKREEDKQFHFQKVVTNAIFNSVSTDEIMATLENCDFQRAVNHFGDVLCQKYGHPRKLWLWKSCEPSRRRFLSKTWPSSTTDLKNCVFHQAVSDFGNLFVTNHGRPCLKIVTFIKLLTISANFLSKIMAGLAWKLWLSTSCEQSRQHFL